MSRYSRDDPRSIFFSGSPSTGTSPLRGYAGSELFRRNPAAPSAQPPADTPKEAPAATEAEEAKPAPHSPVVRIIPILYPAQPARLIGNPTSYGRPPAPPNEPEDAARPLRTSLLDQQPSTSAAAAAPPTTPNPGILKSPYSNPTPSTSTPSRVSFSNARTNPPPNTARTNGNGSATQRPTTGGDMAGTSSAIPSASARDPPPATNGVHGRVLNPKLNASSELQPNSPPPDSYGGGGGGGGGGGSSGGAARRDGRMQLALYGWRKKCLYALMFALMVMIIVNLALTLWIMKVMEFSSNGMGQLKIVPGGLQLSGQALILNTLRASSIRSKHGQPISIESSRNLTVNTRNPNGAVETQLFLGHDRLDVAAQHFRITDTHGNALFAVDREAVVIGAGSLRMEGEGGVNFGDSIQTPVVRAEAGKDLMLESPTRALHAQATQEIYIQSLAGGIETTCLNDLKLRSVDGTIRLDSRAIYMPNLKTVHALPGSSSSSYLSSSSSARGEPSAGKIYQLCVCENGKLFLAAPNGICASDDSATCR
ncbi:YEATS domain-containing protein 2 [Anopheles ziemanni]|uniref:YEATS domain-containing protein 2 n=1 Tax=Anopheles coustani TaxID=139045 RepID=UPI00265ADC6E|nr:YEATS domain-containing protein 2 [Anopheles coustani]XP_058175608.1 YEATS domain-containing protein 2 [Anopheles ziemanni]